MSKTDDVHDVVVPQGHGYHDQKYAKGNLAPNQRWAGVSWESEHKAIQNATAAGNYAKTMDNAADQLEDTKTAEKQPGDFMENVGKARLARQTESLNPNK